MDSSLMAQRLLSANENNLHRQKVTEKIANALPESLPKDVGFLIASYIPSNLTVTVKNFNHAGPYRTDITRRLVPLTDPMQFEERVTRLTVNIQWNDQGWGNMKGSLHLVHFTTAEKKPPKSLCIGRLVTRDHSPFSCTLDQSVLSDFMATNIVAGHLHWLELWTHTGGGGGHRLVIQTLSATVTRGYRPEQAADRALTSVFAHVSNAVGERLASTASRLEAVREARRVLDEAQRLTEAEVATVKAESSKIETDVRNRLARGEAVTDIIAAVERSISQANRGAKKRCQPVTDSVVNAAKAVVKGRWEGGIGSGKHLPGVDNYFVLEQFLPLSSAIQWHLKTYDFSRRWVIQNSDTTTSPLAAQYVAASKMFENSFNPTFTVEGVDDSDPVVSETGYEGDPIVKYVREVKETGNTGPHTSTANVDHEDNADDFDDDDEEDEDFEFFDDREFFEDDEDDEHGEDDGHGEDDENAENNADVESE